MVTKHCNINTKINSPQNNETPPKNSCGGLQYFKQIFENDYYGFKNGDNVFQRNFQEFNVSFDQLHQKIISILLLQIS